MSEREKGWQPDPIDKKGFRWHDGKGYTGYTSEVDPNYPSKAGWYPDPNDPASDMVHYWNGNAWTETLSRSVVEAKENAEDYFWNQGVWEESRREKAERKGESSRPQNFVGRIRSLMLELRWLLGLALATFLLIFIILALLPRDDEPTNAGNTTTTVCVAAEFDLAPGAPDPCAPSAGETTAATSTPNETTNTTSSATSACTPRTFRGTIDGSVAGRAAPGTEHYELVELVINPDCSLTALLVWIAEYPDDATASNPDAIWCAAFIGEDFNMSLEMTGEDSGTATGRLSANVEGPLGHCPEVDNPRNPTGIGSYLRQGGQDATFTLNGDTITGTFTDTYQRFTVTFTATASE